MFSWIDLFHMFMYKPHMEFEGLIQSIKTHKYTKHIIREEINLEKPFCPLQIQILPKDKKGCQRLNHILSSNKQDSYGNGLLN